ncbi:MAG: YaiO family outer membrane beta-barrel protein [Balneolaceae bacterium]
MKKLDNIIKRVLFAGLIYGLTISTVIAQEVDNVDTAFSEAQVLAFDGNREEARQLAYAILEIAPDYHDVRLLIARTYSWDEEYDLAREELEYVLQREPNHKAALLASIDNESWAENYDEAVRIASVAANYYPIDVEVLLKTANANYLAEDERTALRMLDRVDQLNPASRESRNLRESIRMSSQNYTLSGSYTYDWFSEIFDPVHKSYLQLSRRTSIGSIIGRVNYGNRFDTIGFQPEIDFYPSIAEGWYGYLNIGVSNSSIFPEFRAGAELHKGLPYAFEISAGFRYLKFQNSDVMIYTGTITKYQGNWLFTLRPYITPSNVGFSRSVNVRARRYFGGPDDYITFRGGFGFSPEERRFQDVSGDVFLVESRYLGVDVFKSIQTDLAIFASFDAARQELTFSPGDYTNIFTVNGGLQIRF